MERTAFRVTFGVNDQKYAVTVPRDVADSIELIKRSLAFREGGEEQLEFKFETTTEAILNYMRYKASLIRKDPSLWSGDKLTIEDWRDMSHVAIQMADFDFFDDFSKFPPLDEIVDHLFEFPGELITKYIEEYLTRCFLFECSCNTCYWRRERQKAQIEFEELAPETQDEITEEFRYYFQLSLTSIFSPRVVFNICDESFLPVDKGGEHFIGNDNVFWLPHGSYNLLKRWFARSIWEREIAMLVDCQHVKIAECLDKQPFCTSWTRFYSMYPDLARFIWDNVDRKELIEITQVPIKKRSRMTKSTFDEMVRYIDSLKSKEVVADPVEGYLRSAVKEAERTSRRFAYENTTGELAMAEARLAKYLANRKKEQHRTKAKEAVQRERTGISTKKIHLNPKLIKK